MDSELKKIKASILEIRDSLSEPLKGFLDKEIEKTEGYFKQAECIVYFDTCLKYAKKCKKIEKDFPSRWSHELTTDPKLFNTFLFKLLSVCVFDNPSNEIDEIKDNIYRDVRDILKKLLSSTFHQTYKRYKTRDSIKKNILELLILLLDKKEGAKFSKEYKIFFTDIISFIEQDTINLNDYLNKVDNLEKSEYFYSQNLANIRRKFFEIIFSIDHSIIYRNLLVKIEGIAKREFSDHPAVFSFINCFIFELINKKNDFGENPEQYPNERFDLGMVLIYQALNRKCEQTIIPSSKINFFKRLITLPPKATFGGQLSKFKQDYQDKTGKEFSWGILSDSDGKVSPGKQVRELPKEIAVYFSTREINRSPKAVKKAFKIALRTYDKLESSEDQQTKTTPIERVNEFKAKGVGLWKAVKEGVKKGMEKGVEKVTDIIEDASNKVTEAFEMGQEVVGSAMDSARDKLKDTVSNIKLPASISTESTRELSKENKDKLFSLRAELEAMALQLEEIKSLLKQSMDHRCVEENASRRMIGANDEELNDEEYVNHLETQSKVIKINIGNVYSEAINKSILEIGETIQLNSWFKDKKVSLMESIKAFFSQGCFYVSLDKFKNRLNDKIDFISEKDFFLKAGFFALLRYGVIRWPGRNREDFAINWAEQIILLKTKDYIEKKTHEELNKANVLLILIKLHGEVFYRLDKSTFFSDLYKDIDKAGIEHFPAMASLREKINRRIGFRVEVDSPIAPEINLDNTANNAAFFNARNKEQEPSYSDQSSLCRTPSPSSSSI